MSGAAPAAALAPASLALARRFHQGATLWCWSPTWPSDAAHVAVEFVHPVIVGKRALPAVALGAGADADRLRHATRPGDVVLLVGPGTDARLLDVCTRAPAWGLDTFWLASSSEPPADTGARVIWLGADAARADVVCAYHLLWELTHACFDRPGLLEGPGEAPACAVCMDAGDLGEVVATTADGDASAIVAGVRQRVDLSLVGPCDDGALVVVHAGVAIAIASLAGVSGG